jgi:two-component system CheB/CheR fusion protein
MNDELQSINEELRDRTTELDQVNRFMDSVLTSLSSAVIVIDRELTIKAWNRRAEDLWGLRREEVLGQHFLNLDIGLPVYELGPVVRDFLAGQPQPGNGLVLNAVNRRGKPISVRVALGHLSLGAEDHDGVILAIDETAEAAG